MTFGRMLRYLSTPVILATLAPAPSVGDEAASGPAAMVGEWIGQYQTRQAQHGQLRLTVSEVDGEFQLEVISHNEHYPSAEPEELDSYEVGDGRIAWVLHFGPSRVEWTGERKGDFIVGELTGTGEHHSGFKGYWTAVRASSTVKP